MKFEDKVKQEFSEIDILDVRIDHELDIVEVMAKTPAGTIEWICTAYSPSYFEL